MAEHYLTEIRLVQPHGPYAIAGHSFGGLIAFEIAQRLRSAGEWIDLLALFDTHLDARNLSWLQFGWYQLKRTLRVAGEALTMSPTRGLGHLRHALAKSFRPLEERSRHPLADLPEELPVHFEKTRQGCLQAMTAYRVRPYDGCLTYFRADLREPYHCDPLPVWRRAAQAIAIHPIAGEHLTMMQVPYIGLLAEKLSECLLYCSSDTDIVNEALTIHAAN